MKNTEIQNLIDKLQTNTGVHERLFITVPKGTKKMLQKQWGTHGGSEYVRSLIIRDLKKRIKID